MSKKKAGIITASVLAAGLAIGGVTTGVVLANRPLDITYYANNGTPAVTAQINKGDSLNLPTPTREGYNFAGWYTNVGLTEQVTKETKLKNNSKLYAGWELANYELASANSEIAPFAETAGLKSIGAGAFANTKITSVTIPDTVTTIGEGAFSGCANLQTITIGESVTSIGDNAFRDCTAVTKINFNAKSCSDFSVMSSSGNNVFYNTGIDGDGITVTFGDNVTRIPANLFNAYYYGSHNTPKITSVIIGNGVTNIGSSAFNYSTALTSITIPENVRSMGSRVFSGCINLKSATIKSANVGGYAFSSCTALTNITLSNNVASIGEYAFNGCTSITSITIPESVASIGYYAFGDCSGLTSITIPENVTSIGFQAFNKCTSLTKVNFNATACADMSSSNRGAFSGAGTKGDGIEVTFGDNVTKIPAYLLYESSASYAAKVTSVTIPNSVTSVGTDAFKGCDLNNLYIDGNIYTQATSNTALGGVLPNVANVYVKQDVEETRNEYFLTGTSFYYKETANGYVHFTNDSTQETRFTIEFCDYNGSVLGRSSARYRGTANYAIDDTPQITSIGVLVWDGWFATMSGDEKASLTDIQINKSVYRRQKKLTLNECSWTIIKQVSEKKQQHVCFNIGDEKKVTLTDGTIMTMQIADFNHDVDKNGSKIPITFVTKEIFRSSGINSSATNVGGWYETSMRTYLNSDIYNLLPDELKSSITSAMKKSTNGGASAYTPGTTAEDKLFLLSCAEVNYNATSQGYSMEGTPYALFTDNASRIRYNSNGSAYGGLWWLRSPCVTINYNFMAVNSSGDVMVASYSASYPHGICFAFCV